MAEDKYKQFFEKIWADYCDVALSLEDAEAILKYAMDAGLVKQTAYDPDEHGERGIHDWGCEKGDPWYVLA